MGADGHFRGRRVGLNDQVGGGTTDINARKAAVLICLLHFPGGGGPDRRQTGPRTARKRDDVRDGEPRSRGADGKKYVVSWIN